MNIKHILALGVAGTLAAGVGVPLASASPTVAESTEHTGPRIPVIVMLNDQPGRPSANLERSNVATQAKLIESWSSTYGLEIDRQFGYLINGFSATMPEALMNELAAQPQVASVKKERVYYPTEYNGRDMHGVPAAFADYGVDGTGTVVSIIDTGIDLTHQDMRLDDGVCEASKLQPAEGFTCKVPNGFNYADENTTVLDTTSSQHGMHVAGIVAANGSEGDTPPDPVADGGRFDGAAPNAQLLAMKVFSNDASSGAYDSDIIAAIEDSYKLGADVINMSLGSPNGQKDDSDGAYRAIEKAREHGVLAVVSAGNDGLNFAADGTTGDLFGLLDDATVGAPGTQGSAFTVASIDNNFQLVPIASYNDGTDHELTYLPQGGEADGQSYEIVDVGLSQPEDYTEDIDLTGKYALVERGINTFTEKFENAVAHNAEGIVVFNSEEGGNEFVGMAGIEGFEVFSASIYREDGLAIREALKAGTVTVKFTQDLRQDTYGEGLTPSSFTSWGPTPTLDFEPEISGIGGSVYSTLNDNKYGTMSGTSMAAPNVAGLSALLMEHYKDTQPDLAGPALLDRVTTVLMNTAQIPAKDGVPYAPRQIGAGLVDIKAALDTPVFATVDGEASVALRQVDGNRSFTVTLTNTTNEDVTYSIPTQKVVNETNEAGQDTVTLVSGESLTPNTRTVTVPGGGTATVDFTLVPDTSYAHYIEGWAEFTSENAPNISVPYLGFVGDWNAEPIVKAPGEVWLEEANESYTSLATTWGGQTIPLDIIGVPFWLSPNGDGDIDTVNPSLLLMRNAAEAEFEVLDAEGNLVRAIGSEQELYRTIAGDHIAYGSGTTYLATSQGFDGLVWNAEKGDYDIVPDGQYIYRVKTRLGEGYDWQITDLPFGVDNTAPVIEFGEYADGTLTFTVVEDGSGLAEVPTVTAADGTDLEVSGENGTYTVVIPEGTAYITVSVLDLGFNLAVATKVFGDSTLVVSSADQINATVLTPASQVVTDDSLIVQGYVSGDITKVTVGSVETEVVDGRFTELAPLTEGENTIEVVGFNAAGEEIARVTLTPVYDSTPPTLVVDQPSPVSLAEDGSVTISGSISDERADAELTVTIAGEEVEVGADGTFTHTFTPAEDITSITVVGSDGGNTAEEVLLIEGRSAGEEWLPPFFTNVECVNGFQACFIAPDTTDMVDENTFLLKGQIDSPVSSFTLTPASYVGEDGQYVHPEPIEVTVNEDGSFEVPIPVKTGLLDFRLAVSDGEGNPVVDQSVKFYFDITAPTIEFTEPILKSGTLFTSEDEVTFSGTASDDGWGYELFLNDSSIEEIYYGSGTGPESNEREFSAPVAVKNGDQILVQFTDSNGNTLLGIIPVVVDKEAPAITNTIDGEDADGAVITEREEITTTATDENLASLQVSLNGNVIATKNANVTLSDTKVEDALVDSREIEGIEDAIGSTASSLQTTLSNVLDTSELASGTYELTSVATDLASNTTTTVITFTIDDAPVIEGEDAITLTIDREQLADQPGLADLVLENYTLVDDSDTELILAPGQVLVDGENTVLLQVVDADGVVAEKTITVTIELNERTLEDLGVTATGTFRSDDSLTVTKSGSLIAITNEYATLPATIAIPGEPGLTLYKIVGDNQRIPVDAEYVDGKYVFEGDSKGTYELVKVTEPEKPGRPDPIIPDPVIPGPVTPAPDPTPQPNPGPQPEKGNLFYLANSWDTTIADIVFTLGRKGDEVLIGDWDGNGTDTVSVRRGNTYYISNTNDGKVVTSFTFGKKGDEVLIGDWNGDGKDTIAVRRGDRYYLSNDLKGGFAEIEFTYGKASDEVLVGDWNGDKVDTLGVRRGSRYFLSNKLASGNAEIEFVYGTATDEVFAGDWDGNGTDTLAVRRGRTFHVKNTLGHGPADVVIAYGRPGDAAYVGDWDGNGTDTPVVNRFK